MRLSPSAACALSVASLVCSGVRAARLTSKVCASVYVCVHARSCSHCRSAHSCARQHMLCTHALHSQAFDLLAVHMHVMISSSTVKIHFFPRHRSTLAGAARSHIERTHTVTPRLPLAALRTLIPGQVPLLPLPPMGWMSWLRFECETDCAAHPTTCISASLYTSAADAMVAGGYAAAG
jgi:hypothetical protein